MSGVPITVGILEDQPAARDYLAAMVEADAGLSLAFAVETLADARAHLRDAAPDICLVDLQLPDGHGTDFIRDMRETVPSSRALVLTMMGDRDSVMAAFACGASGYLIKDTPGTQIGSNLRAVVQGGTPISPQAARHLLGLLPSRGGGEDVLSAREIDVLTAFAKGLSYQETADVLQLSLHTVRHHVRSIYKKLSVNSRNEAIFTAVKRGLLSI